MEHRVLSCLGQEQGGVNLLCTLRTDLCVFKHHKLFKPHKQEDLYPLVYYLHLFRTPMLGKNIVTLLLFTIYTCLKRLLSKMQHKCCQFNTEYYYLVIERSFFASKMLRNDEGCGFLLRFGMLPIWILPGRLSLVFSLLLWLRVLRCGLVAYFSNYLRIFIFYWVLLFCSCISCFCVSFSFHEWSS